MKQLAAALLTTATLALRPVDAQIVSYGAEAAIGMSCLGLYSFGGATGREYFEGTSAKQKSLPIAEVEIPHTLAHAFASNGGLSTQAYLSPYNRSGGIQVVFARCAYLNSPHFNSNVPLQKGYTLLNSDNGADIFSKFWINTNIINMTPFASYALVTGVADSGTAGIDATAAFYGSNPSPTTGLGTGGIVQDTTSPVVYLPPGEYDISACPASKPYMASATSLVGAGRGKTIIKYTGTNCVDTLLGWAGQSHWRISGITIDINGATAQATATTPVASTVVQLGNGTDALFDDFEIKGMHGNYWYGINAVGFSNGRVRNSHIAYADATTGTSGAVATLNSYLGSYGIGSITGSVLSLKTMYAGSGPVVGAAVVGHGVPDGEKVASFGSGKGGAGTYNLTIPVMSTINNSGTCSVSGTTVTHLTGQPFNSHITSVNLAGTSYGATYVGPTQLTLASFQTTVASKACSTDQEIDTSMNFGWIVDHTKIDNGILIFDGPDWRSDDNEISGWATGAGITVTAVSQYGVSSRDNMHDSASAADINANYLSGIENHADDVQILNPTVSNVAGRCLGLNSLNTHVHGGFCTKWAQASKSDAVFDGYISGCLLTVTSTTSGTVGLGQIVSGTGVGTNREILSVGATPSTYHLTGALQSAGSASSPIALTGTANNGNDAANFTLNDTNNSGSSIEGMTLFSGGTSGEKFGITDDSGVAGTYALGNKVVGAGVSPYRIRGGTIVVDFGAAMTVGQLSYLLANKGTVLGIVDATSPTYNGSLTGGGSVPVLAIGNGSAFTSH